MRSVTILAGCGKDGRPEPFDSISLERGGLYTIVGNTCSGSPGSSRTSSNWPAETPSQAAGSCWTERRSH